MYINPKTAIENGWITHPDLINPEDWEKYLQPNAIDFSLDKLFSINSNNTFIINEDYKQMRGGDLLEPFLNHNDDNEYWSLDSNSVYDGMSDMYVTIPKGVACELIIRSTFNRNGIFLTSGLYDSGFENSLGFVLHNRSGDAKIGVGTRIGQIKFIASDSAGTYDGQYNENKGKHWNT